ncbi:DUF3304 domain-containing protein [Providencia vermicola]|uniref:DUF3304 domain-containing protein n=3 Tax=Morganellaceae TaxID=1903414 RepID=UPI0013A78176|nr:MULTISPECIES: DUF3304 domain-containing protein [Providencia]QIC17488.1 DUF3304 domain-containing protein [Providencia vermicola]WBA57318.1 DUF3304 domain-containing protein [Providencia sp. 21OH12SH02B-Prov]
MQWLTKITLSSSLFLLLACSPDEKKSLPEKSEYLAGNLSGFNHVKGTNVNWFTVNGYGGRTGGFTCCVMLPPKWNPNLTAEIEWEIDPNPYPKNIPTFDSGNYPEFAKKHKANYRQYQTTVKIPEYSETCGLTVHFLPCQQVKVTTSCYTIDHPDYPIKDAFDQEEPASCQK